MQRRHSPLQWVTEQRRRDAKWWRNLIKIANILLPPQGDTEKTQKIAGEWWLKDSLPTTTTEVKCSFTRSTTIRIFCSLTRPGAGGVAAAAADEEWKGKDPDRWIPMARFVNQIYMFLSRHQPLIHHFYISSPLCQQCNHLSRRSACVVGLKRKEETLVKRERERGKKGFRSTVQHEITGE